MHVSAEPELRRGIALPAAAEQDEGDDGRAHRLPQRRYPHPLFGCNGALVVALALLACSHEEPVTVAPSAAKPSPLASHETTQVVAAVAPDSASPPGETPPALRCLERYYGGHAVWRGAGFWLDFGADGAIVEHDGREKSFDERLATPDVGDMFTPRYRRGPLAAVEEKDFDPGRARPALLFQETYGATAAAVSGRLVPVRLVAGNISVHRRAAEPLRRVATRLAVLVEQHPDWRPLFEPLGGGFNFRNVAGTEQRSAHAFGVAVDLNPKWGAYWRWQKAWTNRIPPEIVDAFESEGFIWGGRWYHFDTMHFEYRPELLDDSCYKRDEAAPKRGP